MPDNYWIAQFDDVLGEIHELCEERVTFMDRWFKKQQQEAPTACCQMC